MFDALAAGALDEVLGPRFDGDAPAHGRYELLELLPRRNLVFVSWRRLNDEATGTWILGFDAEGRLDSFAPVAATDQ